MLSFIEHSTCALSPPAANISVSTSKTIYCSPSMRVSWAFIRFPGMNHDHGNYLMKRRYTFNKAHCSCIIMLDSLSKRSITLVNCGLFKNLFSMANGSLLWLTAMLNGAHQPTSRQTYLTIHSWQLLGQQWTGVFESLWITIVRARAE